MFIEDILLMLVVVGPNQELTDHKDKKWFASWPFWWIHWEGVLSNRFSTRRIFIFVNQVYFYPKHSDLLATPGLLEHDSSIKMLILFWHREMFSSSGYSKINFSLSSYQKTPLQVVNDQMNYLKQLKVVHQFLKFYWAMHWELNSIF